MIYLDHNATTPVHPEVQRTIAEFLGPAYGNPSSTHALGRVAKRAVNAARTAVAAAIGAAGPEEIVFTGSATESDNLAVLGACAAAPSGRRHLVISAIEHPAVLEPALELQRQGWRLSIAPVDASGRLLVPELAGLLRREPVALVSVMHANNELGTIQPIEEIAPLVRQHGALLHVDAAQSMGKVPVDVGTLGADLLTLAGHKMMRRRGSACSMCAGAPCCAPRCGAPRRNGGCGRAPRTWPTSRVSERQHASCRTRPTSAGRCRACVTICRCVWWRAFRA